MQRHLKLYTYNITHADFMTTFAKILGEQCSNYLYPCHDVKIVLPLIPN